MSKLRYCLLQYCELILYGWTANVIKFFKQYYFTSRALAIFRNTIAHIAPAVQMGGLLRKHSGAKN